MRIKNLQIIHFRNHQNYSITSNKPHIWIVGKNGLGKTNILESVYWALTGKSPRTSEMSICIPWESETNSLASKLTLDLNGKDVETKSSLYINDSTQKKELKIQIDDISKKPHSIRKILPVIYFCPEDIETLSGSPNSKRNFLDEIFIYLDEEYKRDLNNFNGILRRRNSLLKDSNNINIEHLNIWDEQIFEAISILNTKRMYLTGKINEKLNSKLPESFLTKFSFQLDFIPSFSGNMEDWLGRNQKDILAKTTTRGSHRDTYELKTLQNIDIKDFASRGERRIIHLAVLLSGIDLIEEKLGFKPLLLIDDVFSELDEEYSKEILNLLNNYNLIGSSIFAPDDIQGEIFKLSH